MSRTEGLIHVIFRNMHFFFSPSTADCGMTNCLCSSQPHEWARWAPAVVLHNSAYVIFIFTRLQFHFFPFAFPQKKKIISQWLGMLAGHICSCKFCSSVYGIIHCQPMEVFQLSLCHMETNRKQEGSSNFS